MYTRLKIPIRVFAAAFLAALAACRQENPRMEAIADVDCDMRIRATQRDYWIDWVRKLDRLGYEPYPIVVVEQGDSKHDHRCRCCPIQPQVRKRPPIEQSAILLAATYHEIGKSPPCTGLTLLFDRPVQLRPDYRDKILQCFHLEYKGSMIPANQVYQPTPQATPLEINHAVLLPLTKKDAKLVLRDYRLILNPAAFSAASNISPYGRSLVEWKRPEDMVPHGSNAN